MFNQDFTITRATISDEIVFNIDIENEKISKKYVNPRGPYEAEDQLWDFLEYVNLELDKL